MLLMEGEGRERTALLLRSPCGLGSLIAQYIVYGWSEPLAILQPHVSLLMKFFLVLVSSGSLRAQRSERPLRCFLEMLGGTGSPLQHSWNERGQCWAQVESPGDSVSSCLLMDYELLELWTMPHMGWVWEAR